MQTTGLIKRGAELRNYCYIQSLSHPKVSALAPALDVIMAYRCCGPYAVHFFNSYEIICWSCDSRASKEEAAACGSQSPEVYRFPTELLMVPIMQRALEVDFVISTAK